MLLTRIEAVSRSVFDPMETVKVRKSVLEGTTAGDTSVRVGTWLSDPHRECRCAGTIGSQ